MLNIAVLVSGGGTNLQAVIDGIENGKIKDTKIVSVIATNPDAYAITRAKNAGIPAEVIWPKAFATRDEFNEELLARLKAINPDLIVLAGCLVVIPPAVVESFERRIINIHPSLIPAYCGKGFYGLKVHEAVLAAGEKVTGATVHFVDEGTDTGDIIIQKKVEVKSDDTPSVLQRRVMEEAEWVIMPDTINRIASGEIKLGRQ